MTDQEIYELASHVLTSIVSDLSKGIYTELGGSLTLSWSTKPKVSAWAESLGSIENPPQHRIVISYELARQFYRDAEDYYEFAANQLLEDRFQLFFQNLNPKPELPAHIAKIDGIRNMFIGGLTWVFFHELGHLMQEHGYVRTSFGTAQPTTHIEDCESDGTEILEGRAAIISHATEIAADIEATNLCMIELARHFLTEVMASEEEDAVGVVTERANKEHSFLEFRCNLHLVVCGISCAFYRFHGLKPFAPDRAPINSHPTPIRRLEVCLPNIFEKLDFGGVGEKLHGLNRSQLVDLCTGAAYSVGFFWLWRYAQKSGIPEHFMPKGLLQDPFKETYWSAIVNAWDEIEPTIIKIRRFGSKLGILSFTPAFRAQVLGLDG